MNRKTPTQNTNSNEQNSPFLIDNSTLNISLLHQLMTAQLRVHELELGITN